jgi:hypothetical protein
LPWPDFGDGSDIHDGCADTVQAHSGWVETDTVPAPPAAANEAGVASSVTWHLVGDGPVDVVDDDPQAAAKAPASASTSAVINLDGAMGRPKYIIRAAGPGRPGRSEGNKSVLDGWLIQAREAPNPQGRRQRQALPPARAITSEGSGNCTSRDGVFHPG